ncbi:hypothetical protein GGTG_03661 [Gaeumannomyces tritici R3-111a-1]|uniref:Copper transport protein n=1 Tax=Gaeumannomyces tritici (strain R3-111a-1) TaxID=644352 RepID=J3NQV5_GAET3|nr:hypothetical protein GGTG_03661 [Gaeumannomyces tritici R3-111a-1]EJT78561.1 hypothetical protein GGTG_03661 [Gaeumannomyces tritici R3-111a-1]
MNTTTTSGGSSPAPEHTGHVMSNMPGMNGIASHGGSNGCKISMLWNWNTVDVCFISSTWQITSTAMFAGSCVGVVLLTVFLEALRRAVKEYDRFLARRHTAAAAAAAAMSSSPPRVLRFIAVRGAASSASTTAAESKEFLQHDEAVPAFAAASGNGNGNGNGNGGNNNDNKTNCGTAAAPCAAPPFRPTLGQQVVRAGLHTVQFAVAYFLMLLAMYYNGYFIICIFLGAFLGAMTFQWEPIGGGGEGQTSAAKEATVCCG